MKYFQMVKMLSKNKIFERPSQLWRISALGLSLLCFACTPNSQNPSPTSAAATSDAAENPAIPPQALASGGTDTSGGNLRGKEPEKLSAEQIRLEIIGYNFNPQAYPVPPDALAEIPIFFAARQGIQRLQANMDFSKYPLGLFNRELRYYNMSEASIYSFQQEEFQKQLDGLEPILRSLVYGTEYRPYLGTELFYSGKFHLNILAKGACWDSFAKEGRDASISADGELCFSLERIAGQVDSENVRRKLYALTMHEICHYYGCDEAQANRVQDFFLAFPILLDDRESQEQWSLSMKSWGILTPIYAAIEKISDGSPDSTICLPVSEAFSKAQDLIRTLGDTRTLLLPPANEIADSIAMETRRAKSFCYPHQPRNDGQVNYADKTALLDSLLKAEKMLTLLEHMGSIYNGMINPNGNRNYPRGDISPNVREVIITPEYAKLNGVVFPEERAIDPEKIKCTLHTSTPGAGEQTISFAADTRPDFAEERKFYCTEGIQYLGPNSITEDGVWDFCGKTQEQLAEHARKIGLFKKTGFLQFPIGKETVSAKYSVRFQGGKNTESPNLELVHFHMQILRTDKRATENGSLFFDTNFAEAKNAWLARGPMSTNGEMRGNLAKGTAETTSGIFSFIGDNGDRADIRVECKLEE